MKRLLAIIFLAIIVIGAWFLFFKKNSPSVKSEESHKVAVTKHSEEFNKSIDNVIDAYINLKNTFVDWDSTAAKQMAAQFIASTDSLKLDEIQKNDSSIYAIVSQNVSDLKANAEPILKENDIAEMRQDFSMISENLYPLLKTVGYEGPKLYWQNCPMAFGDDKPANWLSKTSKIENPYLGRKHPEYKSAMVSCGENMDSLYLK
ncbi:MAG: DUF3347 domain-containing protein [Ginsengibacter sp.]